MARPSRPALAITSPRHPISFMVVFAFLLISIQMLSGVVETRALNSVMPDAMTPIIPAIMLGASTSALLTTVVVPRVAARDAVQAVPFMVVEALAKALLGGTVLMYAASLTKVYGWSGGALTQTLAWCIGVGVVLRVIQIWRETRRVRVSAAENQPASPVPLGDIEREG